MEKRATRYRGYLIEGHSPGLGSPIEAHPTKAVAHARAQIDAALSLVAHVSAGTVYIGGSDRYE
jgi:hypothetical protein